MNVEIEMGNFKNAYILYHNVSCRDYTLTIESKNNIIDIDRISLDDIRLLKKAIDIFLEGKE